MSDDVVPRPSSLAVAVTTVDRHAACLRQLRVLAAAARAGGALDGVVGRVILVDQGLTPLGESAEFAAVQADFDGCPGVRLTVIRQQNLGDSSGFTRGLHEGFKDSRITHVALVHDDAPARPESLAHAWAFAQAASRPTLVQPPSMSLVPRAVVEAIGLPMPFYLGWDDVEFEIRAAAAGFPSVALPGGVASPDSLSDSLRDSLDKIDESGWQTYFLLRNRIVTALLHDGRRTVLVAEWMTVILRHLVRREPAGVAVAALRWAALKDVLHGPGWLHRDLGTARQRAAETVRREIVAPHPVSAMVGSLTAGARLLRRWSDLRAQYRSAVPEATSSQRWAQTFTGAVVLDRRRPIWSIVVTSFHSLDMLTSHWEGLIEAGEVAGIPARDVEVIVVDNADEPEVEAFVREQGFSYLPMGNNVGLSAANNRGAELATGDYLLFANPDLGVVVGDLPILAAEIERTGGIVAPRLDFADGTPQSAARGKPYLFAKLAHRGLGPKAALERYLWPVSPHESGPVVWCAGGATSLSREVFDRIGGWPEEYFLYMEDVELGVRAGLLGIPVSVTAALRWVHEWRGDSRRRFSRGQFLHLRSAVRFYTRYPEYLGWPR